jgi:hypothetical protein
MIDNVMRQSIIAKLNVKMVELFRGYDIPVNLQDANLVEDDSHRCLYASFNNAERDILRAEFEIDGEFIQVRRYDRKTGYWLEMPY